MTDFDCRQFARWLDDGGADPAVTSQALAHAAECPECGEHLAGEQAALSQLRGEGAVATLPPVPGGFADRVMRQVALTPQVRASRLPAFVALPVDVLPWWIRAVVQPAGVLALMLAGVAAAFTPQLLGISRRAPQWSADALAALSSGLAPWVERANAIVGRDPLTGSVVLLALLPLAVLAAFGLYRLGALIGTLRLTVPARVPAGSARA
jgi:hypothetical protein